MAIRTVLVDDEPLALEELSYLLKEMEEVAVVGQGHNGVEAVEMIQRLKPDLVILDIQMPGKDGFQVAREVSSDEEADVPYLVFLTAYDQHALKAFEVNAMDYLLKPIDEEALARTIQRVRKRMGESRNMRDHVEKLLRSFDPAATNPRHSSRIAVRKGSRIILVDVNDVVYAHVNEGVVFIVTDDQEGMTGYRTLEELEADLDAQIFWRVHRGYIANINRVSEVIPWFSGTYRLVMNDPQKREIPLSRAQSKKLRRILKW